MRKPGPWSSRTIVLVLATSGSVVALMQTLLVPLLPDLPTLLHVSSDAASWSITATLLASAVATPSVGKLADMFGKKRMLLFSLSVMTLGSFIGAVGRGFGELILARALQGFAMSLIPVAISIMRDEIPREKLDSAVALMSATLGIGAAIGLPLAGVVYSQFGWRAVFWVSMAMGLAMFLLVSLVISESDVKTGGNFDALGAALLSLFLAAFLLPLSNGSTWGWTNGKTLGLFAISLFFLAIFVPWEMLRREPLVDLRTTIYGPVALTNIASIAIGFSMYVNMLSNTELLQIPKESHFGLGLSVIKAGLALLPAGLTMIILSPVSARITKKYGPRITIITGSLVLACGYIFRYFFMHSLVEIIFGAIFVSSGTAIGYAAIPTLIMRSVPISETAAANALNTVIRSIGTSTSSAVIASVFSAKVIHLSGGIFPSKYAFHLVFLISAAAAIIGALISSFLPRRHQEFLL
jgi:MFS family permease